MKILGRYFFSVLTLFLISWQNIASGFDVIPDPAFSPQEVIEIQLRALQNNDSPHPDSGIRRVWAFAHPDNKRVTGPFQRFKEMIKGPLYVTLINHRNHEIWQLARAESFAMYAVRVTATNARVYIFQWQVARAVEGADPRVWLTLGVSSPLLVGEET